MGGRGGRSMSSRTSGQTVGERMLQFAKQHSDVATRGIGDDETDISNRIPYWIRKREGLIGHVYVKRETEKAYLVVEYGDRYKGIPDTTAWVPKSVLRSPSEVRAEIVQSMARSYGNDLYTSYLKDLAADNGVKIGNANGWDKLKAKLTKKNVTFMSRDEFDSSPAPW